jgi:hypothetical protein
MISKTIENNRLHRTIEYFLSIVPITGLFTDGRFARDKHVDASARNVCAHVPTVKLLLLFLYGCGYASVRNIFHICF